MPFNENVEVDILIGLNCSRAIKPLELIPGKEDKPNEKRTGLGWGIISTVRLSKKEDAETMSGIAYNRIVSCEV